MKFFIIQNSVLMNKFSYVFILYFIIIWKYFSLIRSFMEYGATVWDGPIPKIQQ